MTESTGTATEPGSQAQFDFPAGTVLRVRALRPVRLGRRVAIRQGDVTTGKVNRRDQYAVTLTCAATVPGMGSVSVVRWDLELLGVEPATEGDRGQCEFCTARDVALTAALSGDPDQLVCAACHADEQVPTVALSVLADDRPAWTVTRGDLARLAGRALTDAELAPVVKAIGNSTAFEAIADAVIQVCGYPPAADDEDC
jgi:hypothetical protein